jgi:hypothetical protein
MHGPLNVIKIRLVLERFLTAGRPDFSLFHTVLRSLRNIAKSDQLTSLCLSVRPSLRMEHLGSHWTDLHDLSQENSMFMKILEE